MESLRWRRFLLHMPLMPVALVLLGGGVTTEVTGFGYLESLTPSSLPSAVTAEKESAILLSTKTTTTTCNYLDSLQLRHNNPDEGVVAAIAATTTTTSPTTEAIASASTDDWAEKTIAEIPDDHYSKFHPGAGWAGYQHPMYGGYLNNLAISSSLSTTENNNNSSSNNSSSSNSNNSSNNNNDGTAPAAVTTPDASSTTTSAYGVLEAGKKADYGNDIRWGAQVYLDNLK